MTHILDSLSVALQYSVISSLVSGELSFSCCDTVLLWFFMVLAELLLCWCSEVDTSSWSFSLVFQQMVW